MCYRVMIVSVLISIFKVMAVVAMLGAMVVLLVGIRHISSDDVAPDDTDALRHDIDDKENVISQHSLFHEFLTPDDTDPRRFRSK